MSRSTEKELDLDWLESTFKTSKKTIEEYIREIEKHCRYKSMRHYASDIILDDRGRLIDLYDACVEQDAHLASTLETLESQIIGERYALIRRNAKGKPVKDIEETKKIQGTQFTKIIKGIVEAKLYGFTGLEIVPQISEKTGRLKEVNFIERRNISPGQRRIVKRQGMWAPGWSFDDPKYEDNYVLIDTGGIGLFSATTPNILAKKFTFANYVNFSHTYGQPIIHGKTESNSEMDRQRMANDISSAAQNKVIVTGLADEVDIKTFTMSNSERIFTGLIEMVNRDVSNLILGSESMAGATQSYVGSTRAHEDIFRDRVRVYRDYIEDVMNEEVIPRLVKMGFISEGVEFMYSRKLEMSNKDQIDLYQFLTEKYEVSPEEIEQAFGVNVGKQINVMEMGGYSGGGTGGDDDDDLIGPRRMSDEEYYKRYGKKRGTANFLRERR